MVELVRMRPRVIYVPVLLIWLLFLVIVMSGIIWSDLNSAQQQFREIINSHYQQASDRVRTNETVLEGFAALVGSMPELDQPRIRQYAHEMLKLYPHIFMFEIVETVPHEELDAFSKHYQKTLDSSFNVKAFSYESDREMKPVEKQELYMPIVFMEPVLPESRGVLGLDLYSHKFFKRSLEKYSIFKKTVITEPFQLIEGDLAYLMHKPVAVKKYKNLEFVQSTVMLVIRADTLLNREHHHTAGMTELLHHPDFSETDKNGYLHLHKSNTRSALELLVFPRYKNRKILKNESQPFVLVTEYQLGWDNLSWYQLVITLLIGIVSFLVLMIYARIYHKDEVKRLQTANKWFYMANHDALTGLANRHLLIDRLRHAVYQARRLEGTLAVIFIDLNDFKIVNDTYGHEAGDSLLRHFAERLQDCMRAGDTIARMGGDEFVVVVENMVRVEEINQIIVKIRQATEPAFNINDHIIQLSISIGFSIYPDDGGNIDSLINRADTRMYDDKRNSPH